MPRHWSGASEPYVNGVRSLLQFANAGEKVALHPKTLLRITREIDLVAVDFPQDGASGVLIQECLNGLVQGPAIINGNRAFLLATPRTNAAELHLLVASEVNQQRRSREFGIEVFVKRFHNGEVLSATYQARVGDILKDGIVADDETGPFGGLDLARVLCEKADVLLIYKEVRTVIKPLPERILARRIVKRGV